MKRKLASLGASLALALSLLGVVAGPVSALTCPGSDHRIVGSGTVWLILYESPGYNAGYEEKFSSTLCIESTTSSVNIPDLKSVPYFNVQDVVCEGQFGTSWTTWNDCASSFKFVSDCHHSVVG